jgi:hypothetical protein
VLQVYSVFGMPLGGELAYGLTFEALLTAIISLDFLMIKRNVRTICPKVVRSIGQIIRRYFFVVGGSLSGGFCGFSYNFTLSRVRQKVRQFAVDTGSLVTFGPTC